MNEETKRTQDDIDLEQLLAEIDELLRSTTSEAVALPPTIEISMPTTDGLEAQTKTIPVYEGGVPDPETGELVPWMDERYMFCGQVSYRLHTDQDPAIFCNSSTENPVRCGLACPEPRLCAFDDPCFDWDKARQKGGDNLNYPLTPEQRAPYESLDAWEKLKADRRRERRE